MSKPRRYLILPAHGTQAMANTASTAAEAGLTEMAPRRAVALRNRLRSIVNASEKSSGKKPKGRSAYPFNVVASVNENGIKLVEATPEMIAALRFEQPGLRAVPEVFYRPAVARAELRVRLKKPAASVAASKKLVITVVNAATQAPVAEVDVVGFTDFASRTGTMARTSSSGKATLTVTGATTYERLYVQHELPGLWSFLKKSVSTNGALTVELQPLDLSVTDSLRHFHTIGGSGNGSGVKVGVIDSGIDSTHVDLQVAGGLGCVPGSPESQFGPSGPHGTHVAGIIAGRGSAPTGMRGISPGAEIFSYRIFDDSENSGSNFALVKAIRRGVSDGCHLLNMSLSFDHDENTGLPLADEAVKDAIAEAHQAGVVVVAAAGNDGRMPVSFPALDDLVVAVSAVGRKGTFPAKSSESGDAVSPFGTDAKDFLAAFSNVGTELDVAGAGVGVVSTVPGGYTPMSGTSMACPAVTGVLARLLSASAAVLAMPADGNRANAIKDLLFAQARSLGLGISNEGKGLPK